MVWVVAFFGVSVMVIGVWALASPRGVHQIPLAVACVDRCVGWGVAPGAGFVVRSRYVANAGGAPCVRSRVPGSGARRAGGRHLPGSHVDGAGGGEAGWVCEGVGGGGGISPVGGLSECNGQPVSQLERSET